MELTFDQQKHLLFTTIRKNGRDKRYEEEIREWFDKMELYVYHANKAQTFYQHEERRNWKSRPMSGRDAKEEAQRRRNRRSLELDFRDAQDIATALVNDQKGLGLLIGSLLKENLLERRMMNLEADYRRIVTLGPPYDGKDIIEEYGDRLSAEGMIEEGHLPSVAEIQAMTQTYFQRAESLSILAGEREQIHRHYNEEAIRKLELALRTNSFAYSANQEEELSRREGRILSQYFTKQSRIDELIGKTLALVERKEEKSRDCA